MKRRSAHVPRENLRIHICCGYYTISPTHCCINDTRKLPTSHRYDVVDIIFQYTQYIRDFGQKKRVQQVLLSSAYVKIFPRRHRRLNREHWFASIHELKSTGTAAVVPRTSSIVERLPADSRPGNLPLGSQEYIGIDVFYHISYWADYTVLAAINSRTIHSPIQSFRGGRILSFGHRNLLHAFINWFRKDVPYL